MNPRIAKPTAPSSAPARRPTRAVPSMAERAAEFKKIEILSAAVMAHKVIRFKHRTDQ